MDRSTIRELARLCKLALDEDQEARAEARIARLLEYFGTLQEVDTEGVEPSPYPLDIPLRLRADTPGPVLSQEEVLANAPRQRAGSFLVPRVVE